jgi:hypothetical protein
VRCAGARRLPGFKEPIRGRAVGYPHALYPVRAMSHGILILHADEDDRIRIESAVVDSGYPLAGSVGNAGEAVDLAARTSPCVALIDADAGDALAVTRFLTDRCGTSVVLLVGADRAAMQLATGMTVLRKPAGPVEVIQAIEHALESHSGPF